jgi:hypothetical protein
VFLVDHAGATALKPRERDADMGQAGACVVRGCRCPPLYTVMRVMKVLHRDAPCHAEWREKALDVSLSVIE